MTQAKKTGPTIQALQSRKRTVSVSGGVVTQVEKGGALDPLIVARLGKAVAEFANLTIRDNKTGEFHTRTGVDVIEALKRTGFTSAEIFEFVVSKRSLERRLQKNQLLSPEESDRALRLLRIHGHSMRVFGSEEKANRWLRKPCRALDGAIPLDLLASETGAHIVESELHAIDHGIFA